MKIDEIGLGSLMLTRRHRYNNFSLRQIC